MVLTTLSYNLFLLQEVCVRNLLQEIRTIMQDASLVIIRKDWKNTTVRDKHEENKKRRDEK